MIDAPVRLRTPALVALLSLTVASCSFRLVRSAPPSQDWPPEGASASRAERCTETTVPPVVDTVAALVLASLAVLERRSGNGLTPVVLGVSSLPSAASAIYGYGATYKCRRYKDRFTSYP